jgi:hypothetical protein
VLISACELICASFDESVLEHADDQPDSLSNGNRGIEDGVEKILNQFIETSMRRREESCHEAVKEVYRLVSGLRDATGLGKMVDKYVKPPTVWDMCLD